MATRNFDVGADPQNARSVLSLTIGQRYTLQNISTTATLFYREAAVKPAPTMRAHRVESGGTAWFTPGATVQPWFWTDDPGGCPCVLTEAE